MSALRQALADYLAVRRTLGFKLCDSERLLTQFITYLENRGEEHVTIEAAVAWATLPAQGHRRWLSARLTVVRRFAVYLRGLDPSTQIPPTDLLPGQKLHATPYLYSGKEISALMNLSKTLLGSYRQATYRTLIGLLAVTGMRIGETIALDVDDLNIENGVLTVRVGKFGKSRALPLHPSTVTALGDYLCSSDRPSVPTSEPALFVSTVGTRLQYGCVHRTFRTLVRCAGITPRSAVCRPRLHDLRHGFAVNTILDGYQGDDVDSGARLALLSTYLGHTDPSHTYWYLSAAPELLRLAGYRLERHLWGAA